MDFMFVGIVLNEELLNMGMFFIGIIILLFWIGMVVGSGIVFFFIIFLFMVGCEYMIMIWLLVECIFLSLIVYFFFFESMDLSCLVLSL